MADNTNLPAAGHDEVRYQVDSNNRLVAFNQAWDSFASENDAPSLIAGNLVGKPLMGFIDNPEIRHVHEVLLRRARTKPGAIHLPFRCDAPALRRFMTMDISRLPNGNVEYCCRLQRTEPRAPVPLYRRAVDAGSAMARMCSWCNRIETGNNHWLEIEDAVTHLGLLDEERTIPISHTICDACLAVLDNDDATG